MPINVICPGCHTRFNVSDKFAGKSGPCPKCKTVMKIPDKSEEVVIHAPADDSPKDSTGKSVLKPIEREETKFSWTLAVAAGAGCVLVPLMAWVLGRTLVERDPNGLIIDSPTLFVTLGFGAIAVAFPTVLAGYKVLREDELEPYRGTALWLRAGICAVVYAGLWGLYWYLGWMNLYSRPIELIEALYVLPILVVPGALAAVALLDLETISASFHYGFYLLVTIGLRFLMGLPPI